MVAAFLVACATEDDGEAQAAVRAQAGVRGAAMRASEGVVTRPGAPPTDIPWLGLPVDDGAHGSVPAPGDEDRAHPHREPSSGRP